MLTWTAFVLRGVLEPCQTLKVKHFAKIAGGLLLTNDWVLNAPLVLVLLDVNSEHVEHINVVFQVLMFGKKLFALSVNLTVPVSHRLLASFDN